MKTYSFLYIVSLFAGLALMLSGSVSTTFAALDDGLVAHYPFEGSDNTLADASGMGNNGDLGSAQRVDNGRFGKAIRFANNTDKASVPGSESLTFEGDLTVAAWIHPEALSTGDTWPEFENRVIYSNQLNLDVLHAKGRFEIKNPDAWIGTPAAGGDLAVGAWHHILGTYDANAQLSSHYVNGELVGTAAPPAIQVAQSTLHFGHMGIQCMVGSLDDVRLYERAFSEDDVQALFQLDPSVSVSPNGSLVTTWGNIKANRK
ncbi:MAG: LamG domain-containing protein [Candidatus Poribacteria bacterium]|nr:LamG domain-containing protein [Candidatus Poribacteria bacterium]MDE0504197.1 LamG domain-containing protein [Candidatus Poribacteria bacterium]